MPTPTPAPVTLCTAVCRRDSIVVTYFGVSGFLIRGGPLGDSAILTAPSFTHQRLLAVTLPFVPIRPNGALIDWSLSREQLGAVSALLVGHSHYDHLLDVPYIASTKAVGAIIYGSPTTANILAPVAALKGRIHTIAGDDVGSTQHTGRWLSVAGGRARVMAVESNHAPNVGPLRYTYANTIDTRPRSSLPRTTHGWHKGEVYAYLIDLLDAGGKPVFRVFYQDAAAGPDHASLPPLTGDDRRTVDLAIICAGNFGNVTDYPTALLRQLRPKQVIVAHWEDFFRTMIPPFRGISFTDTQLLASRLQEAVGDRWVTPEPMTRMVYRF